METNLDAIEKAMDDCQASALDFLIKNFQVEAVQTEQMKSDSLSDFRGWISLKAKLIDNRKK